MTHGDEHFAKSNQKVYNKLKIAGQSYVLLRGTEYSDDYDFYFDLDNIQIIERNTYTQYTVIVESDASGDDLLNYLLVVYDDGEESQYLITYPRVQTDDGRKIDHYGATMEELDGSSIMGRGPTSCGNNAPMLVDVVTTWGFTTTLCTGGNHEPGDECLCQRWSNGNFQNCARASEDCGWSSVNVWGCGGGGDAGPGPSNGNPGGPDGDPNTDDDDDDDEYGEEQLGTIALTEEAIDHQNNCNELKELSDNIVIKNRIISLQNKSENTSLKNEEGFSMGKNSSNQTVSGNNVIGSQGTIDYGVSNANKFGGVHLHPINGYFPMFSTYDILVLHNFYANFDPAGTLGNDESLPVHIAATPQGIYAIKITDVTKLQAYANNLDTEVKRKKEFAKLNRVFNKIYTSPHSFSSNYQREFLRYAKDLGISFYKANEDLSIWARKDLDETTNEIVPTRCN